MTCFYRVSRTPEEARALMGGERPLGETFLEKDPVRMTAMIRKTNKPCLVSRSSAQAASALLARTSPTP